MERTERLRLRNSRVTEAVIWLEPWGQDFSIPPGAVCEVVFRGPQGDSIEIEIKEDCQIIYGWSGSKVSVYYNGNEIISY